jgi:hypothetical protein
MILLSKKRYSDSAIAAALHETMSAIDGVIVKTLSPASQRSIAALFKHSIASLNLQEKLLDTIDSFQQWVASPITFYSLQTLRH